MARVLQLFLVYTFVPMRLSHQAYIKCQVISWSYNFNHFLQNEWNIIFMIHPDERWILQWYLPVNICQSHSMRFIHTFLNSVRVNLMIFVISFCENCAALGESHAIFVKMIIGRWRVRYLSPFSPCSPYFFFKFSARRMRRIKTGFSLSR